MLQAIAKHQVEVQEKLEKESFVDTTGWIKDMIKTADRIKSNVRHMGDTLHLADSY